MKGERDPNLKELIERLEHRRLMREATTATMAALGLIGFGVMLIPIMATPLPTHMRIATTQSVIPPVSNAYAGMSLIGQAAIVYDLSNGKVIFEKNSTTQLPLASLTKLLTTYAALNALAGTAPVTISPTAIAQDGDSGLTVGETFMLKDLARFALVASSNDAAEAIAETAAAKKGDTSDQTLLASAAAAAGLSQTYAVNGSGLDQNTKVSGGYGTAQDVALLAGALLKQAPDIAEATTLSSVTVSDRNGVVHTLPNTNQDIIRMPNPLLSKTGYTDLAGGNLVVVFDAGINHPVAVVVLGSTRDGRFSDVDQLVSRTLDHFAGIAP